MISFKGLAVSALAVNLLSGWECGGVGKGKAKVDYCSLSFLQGYYLTLSGLLLGQHVISSSLELRGNLRAAYH